MQSLEGLVCPKCHEPLTITEAGRELRCVRDGSHYPMIDGIPSFMTTAGEAVALPGCALTLVIPALNEAATRARFRRQLRAGTRERQAGSPSSCEPVHIGKGSIAGPASARSPNRSRECSWQPALRRPI